MTYIAHTSENGEIQTVKEHGENVAVLCEKFSVQELASICKEIGKAHDFGKYQESFQKRIRGESIKVEHSICGAKVAFEKYGNSPLGLLMALCIAGHHTGLTDCGTQNDVSDLPTLYGRLKRDTESIDPYKQELPLENLNANELIQLLLKYCDSKSKEEVIECFAFLVRYCYSCLVDADTIDTMRSMGNEPPKPLIADFAECKTLIDETLKAFKGETNLQLARSRIQAQAFENIMADADIYLMGTPTGSGKTLASMKCALERAKKLNKKRIIYVIPYNSIINQTVKDFETLFGDSAQILRHQSSFSYSADDDSENSGLSEDYRQSAMFACENWDAQIIITTAVQFFESVYSHRRKKTRKLHNIADSVLVFDEAHLMPVEYLQPCLRAIALATKYLHSEAIFLTATMPEFESLIKRYALKSSKVLDIVPDKSEFKFFKKNTYKDIGSLSDEALLATAMSFPSSLIVVNKRRTAQRLFKKCQGKKYHLSTLMTYRDRTIVIEKVKEELKQLWLDYPDMKDVPPERRIILIATSLIEAGINFDFYTAFRELRGLDNTLQTGGRCNREGKLENGDVFIFSLNDEKYMSPEQIITKGIIRDFDDISDETAIKAYYERLFAYKRESITKNSLANQCEDIRLIPFRTYSENMNLIESESVSIIIPQDDKCKELLEKAKYSGHLNIRKLQNYCCSIYPKELEDLIRYGAVTAVAGAYVLTDLSRYKEDIGLQVEGEDCYI